MASQDHLVERDRQKIGRQISLPFTKAFEIAWKGIMIRIWRSMITMSGIILAISFLMIIWTTSALVSSLMTIPEGTRDRLLAEAVLQKQAIATESISLRVGIISSPQTAKQEGEAIRNLLRPYSEFDPAVIPIKADEFLKSIASGEDRYDAIILTSLPEEFRAPEVLAGISAWVKSGHTLLVYGWREMFPRDTPAETKEILEAILPGKPTAQTVLAEPMALKPAMHNTVQAIDWKTMPGREFVLAEPKPDATVVLTADKKPLISVWKLSKGHVIFIPDAQRLDQKMLDWLRESDLMGKCMRWGESRKLSKGGGSARNMWLVVLSLLVCIVGITNAMLMSVTERFREIGTMKCLGALDVFIIKLFLIESALMGMVGTLIGIFLGFILAYVRATISFAVVDPVTKKTVYLGLRYMPYGLVALRMLMAFGVGVLLSVLAAIYPAWTAARMEPVEAMRTEE